MNDNLKNLSKETIFFFNFELCFQNLKKNVI